MPGRQDGRDIVDLVAGNMFAMPGRESLYWGRYLVPHLILVDKDEVLPSAPPVNWRLYPLWLTHAKASGATNVTACLALRHSLPLQSWTPMGELMNSVAWAPPAAAEEAPVIMPDCTPKVFWQEENVLPWGVFLSMAMDVAVRVPCMFHQPAGWGRCTLTGVERADMWDVPLAHQKWADQGGMSSLLASLTTTIRRKVVVLEGNYLLALCIQSGWGDTLTPRRKGVEVASIAATTPAKASGCKEVRDEVNIDEAFLGNCALVKATTVVTKSDQKVDEASIPVHVWDRMYVLSRLIRKPGAKFALE